MKFKRHCQLVSGLEPIDIVPFINVMFLLLPFLTLASFFTFQSGINVKLPKAVTSDVIQEETIVITITGENILYLNKEVLTLKELTQKLEKIKTTNRFILIKADRRASVGRIVDVWNLCRERGIEKVNIATTQEE